MYDNKWKIGDNFTVIKDEEFSTNMNDSSFNNFLKSLRDLKSEDVALINNLIILLQDYRKSFELITKKSKVGSLTEIENIAKQKLGM